MSPSQTKVRIGLVPTLLDGFIPWVVLFGELGTNMGPMLATVVPDPSDPSMDKFSTMDANVWFKLINESSDIKIRLAWRDL